MYYIFKFLKERREAIENAELEEEESAPGSSHT
jgi:hypothetical protein